MEALSNTMVQEPAFLKPVIAWFRNTFDTENKLWGLYFFSGVSLMGAGSYYYLYKRSTTALKSNTPNEDSELTESDEEESKPLTYAL